MNIIGVSAGFHDASAVMISDGDIIYAGHSERYSNKKNDANLNDEMFTDLTESMCLANKQGIDKIAYYERPWMRYARQLTTGEGHWPRLTDFTVKFELPKEYRQFPIEYFNHHLSHAASGFQTSPYESATCIVIDAIGEFDTITIWDARYDYNNEAQYKKLWSKSFPNSIGLMYSAFTDRVGLKPMEDEYILMGMAAFGKPKQYNELKFLLMADNDLNFRDNLQAGLPEDWFPEANDFDLAASIQLVTEDLIRDVFIKARTLGASRNLCYSGGVALNCVANDKLAGLCENLWIMPNPGDAGAALGAAALAYKKKLNWKTPYLGYEINEDTDYPAAEIVKELLDNKMVGVAHGKAEFGPRALGNRSLLADPRGADVKDRVNTIKRRQKFRPFAPIILEELVHQYFDMPKRIDKSPYMQYTGVCKYPDKFPAIVHEDGTSRVQTVSAYDHPGLYKLLRLWHNETGCPILLNTSLNIKGMPMVNDLKDAKQFERLYDIKVVS